MDFIDLPEEILIHILQFLAATDLLECRLVSLYFRKLVDGYAQLQYIIQLKYDGLVDAGGGAGTLSSAERLQLLHDRRRAWQRMQWRRQFKVPMPQDCQTYELVGGLYVQSRTHQDLTIVRLPMAEDEASSQPKVMMLDFFSRDFAMDPSQDLIVHLDDRPDTYFPHPLLAPPIVLTDASPSQAHHIHHRTIKLYIRTLSTNEEHPLTKRPVFAIPVPQHVLLASISMQIVNSVVGLFITNGFWQPRLVAWNWKSGQMLFDMHADQIPHNAAGFAFLSDTALAISFTANDGGFKLYTFDPGDEKVEDPTAESAGGAGPSNGHGSSASTSASSPRDHWAPTPGRVLWSRPKRSPSNSCASRTQRSSPPRHSASGATLPQPPTLWATLRLPELRPGAHPTHILMHADPFVKGEAGEEIISPSPPFSSSSSSASSISPSSTSLPSTTSFGPSTSDPTPLSPSATLHASSSSRLHVITIGYESADAEVRQFNLFVHNATFLRFLTEGKKRWRAERDRSRERKEREERDKKQMEMDRWRERRMPVSWRARLMKGAKGKEREVIGDMEWDPREMKWKKVDVSDGLSRCRGTGYSRDLDTNPSGPAVDKRVSPHSERRSGASQGAGRVDFHWPLDDDFDMIFDDPAPEESMHSGDGTGDGSVNGLRIGRDAPGRDGLDGLQKIRDLLAQEDRGGDAGDAFSQDDIYERSRGLLDVAAHAMRSLRQDVDDLLRGEADGIGQGEEAEVAQQGLGAPVHGASEQPWLDERDNRSDDSTEHSKHDAPLYACFTWDQWAPERTRLMEEIIPSVLLRYVHGGRAVYPQRITRPEGEERNYLNVLDFNERVKPQRRGLPHHQDVWFGRAHSAQASGNASYTDAGAYEELKQWYAYGQVDLPQLAPGEMAAYVCTRANVVDEPALFAKTLETSLPYRRSVRAVEEEFHALELDHHRIIGFRRDVGDLTVFAF